jgi:DNA-binding LytR/AlgR family response regulator
MKVIIIEDEKLSADHLELLLRKLLPDVEVSGRFDTVKSSIAAFEQGIQADLLFVDIHLADGLSFEIFAAHEIDLPVIFTTAYDEYAVQAFKLNSIDYLLKPIGREDLQFALNKFQKVKKDRYTRLIEDLGKHYRQEEKHKSRFMVRMGDQIVSVKTTDIAYFISEDGAVLLCTQQGKRYIIDYTLDQLEGLLDSTEFFRMNRKVLIQISVIEKVSSYFNGRLKILTPFLEEESCIVSRERVSEFKLWLGQ